MWLCVQQRDHNQAYTNLATPTVK